VERTSIQQFIRFSIIGVLGFFVDAGILMFSVSVLSLNLYIGRIASFLAAVTTTWALNRRYTFRRKAPLSRFGEWLRFMLFNAVGGGVNVGTYAWMIHEFSFAFDRPLIAIACGSIAGLFINFSLTKLFVFSTARCGVGFARDRYFHKGSNDGK
jgi:putative flippase GtrA